MSFRQAQTLAEDNMAHIQGECDTGHHRKPVNNARSSSAYFQHKPTTGLPLHGVLRMQKSSGDLAGRVIP